MFGIISAYVYIYIYICMYVCMYVCIYIYIYIYMYVCMYVGFARAGIKDRDVFRRLADRAVELIEGFEPRDAALVRYYNVM